MPEQVRLVRWVSAEPALRTLGMSDLMKRRGGVEKKVEAAEAAWLEASEALETVEA